jgi:hypothetical protein
MKNVHLLPTDKPSRLAGSEYITNEQGIDKRVLKFKLWDKLIPNKDLKDIGYIPQNIYITSNEEIKMDDWYLDDTNSVRQAITECESYWTHRKDYQKIILTDNPDLIAEGVQPIDNEFLEWFVKNPSCEKVEVSYEVLKPFRSEDKGYLIHCPDNEPLEEPKQELPQLGTKEFNDLASAYFRGELNDLASAYFGGEPKQESHICKYCNAETTQPDDECYAKPKQEANSVRIGN